MHRLGGQGGAKNGHSFAVLLVDYRGPEDTTIGHWRFGAPFCFHRIASECHPQQSWFSRLEATTPVLAGPANLQCEQLPSSSASWNALNPWPAYPIAGVRRRSCGPSATEPGVSCKSLRGESSTAGSMKWFKSMLFSMVVATSRTSSWSVCSRAECRGSYSPSSSISTRPRLPRRAHRYCTAGRKG